MSEFVWPAVVALVAVLAFIRFRPAASSGSPRLKVVKRLQRQVKELERKQGELLTEMEARTKSYLDELSVIKEQAAKRLNDFSIDMTDLKNEFTSIRNRASFRTVVSESKDRASGG